MIIKKKLFAKSLSFLLLVVLIATATISALTPVVQAAERKTIRLYVATQAAYGSKSGEKMVKASARIVRGVTEISLTPSAENFNIKWQDYGNDNAKGFIDDRVMLDMYVTPMDKADSTTIELTLTNTTDNTKDTQQISFEFEDSSGLQEVWANGTPFDLRMAAGDVYEQARQFWEGTIDGNEDKKDTLFYMNWPYSKGIGKWPTTSDTNWTWFVRADDQPVYAGWMKTVEDSIGNDSIKFTEDQIKNSLPSTQQGTNFIVSFLLSLFGIVASLIALLINLEIKVMIILFQQVDAGYKNTEIIALWKEIRNLLNLVFIVALLVMAMSNILGFQKDNYGIKKNLPKFILMVIAVNFSLLFVGLVLDAANIIEATIYGFAGMGPHGSGYPGSTCEGPFLSGAFIEKNSLACRLMDIFKVKAVQNVGPYITAQQSAVGGWNVLLAAFLMLIMLVGIVVSFLGICLLLLARTIALWFLMIVSPIFFVGQAFEPLKKAADQWKEQFFKFAFMHVKFAFFLSIGIRIVDSFRSSFVTGGTGDYVSANAQLTDEGNVILGGSDPIQMSGFMMMLLMFACIWMGVFSSMKSNVGAIDGIADKFSGAGKSTMKFLGKKSTLNWGQDFGIPGGGIAKKIGLPRGLTLKDLYAGGKKYLDQRKANLDATHDLRSGGVAAKLTEAAELAGKGAKHIPGIGGFIQEQAIGVHEGSAATLKRALLQKEKSVAAERIGDVGTDQIASKKMLDNAIAAGKRGEAMHLIEQLGKNEDYADMMFGALMTMVESGQIDMTEAIRTAQQFKGFHSGLLAVEEIAQLTKDENGNYDHSKFKDFMKANKISNKDISDPTKQREALSNLFVNGAFKMTVKTDSELAKEAAARGVALKDHIAALTKKVADMMLVKDDHSKRDFDQQDGETWDNIVTGADKVKMERALGRNHDGTLRIKTNKLARGLLSLQRVLDLTEDEAAELGMNRESLAEQKLKAAKMMEMMVTRLSKSELDSVKKEIEIGDSSYISKSASVREKKAADSGSWTSEHLLDSAGNEVKTKDDYLKRKAEIRYASISARPNHGTKISNEYKAKLRQKGDTI